MLTEQKIKELRAKYNIPEQGLGGSNTQKSPEETIARRRLLASEYDKQKEEPKGRLSETWEDIKQIGSNIKSRFTAGADKIAEINTAQESGEQGVLQSAFQKFGAGSGAASQSLGDIFTGIVKGALSQEQEEAVKNKVEETATAIMENPLVGGTVKASIEAYKNLDENTQRNLEALFNTGMLALDVATLGGGKKLAEKGIKTGIDVAQKGGKILEEGIDTARQPIGTLLEKTGEKIQGTAPIFRPNIKEAGLIQGERASRSFIENAKNYLTGKTDEIRKMSDTAVDYNLAGLTESQIGIQAKREMKNLWKNDIFSALSSIKKKITPDELFKKIESSIEGISDETRKKSLLNALDSIKDDYKKVKEWDFIKLNKLKSEFNERIPNKAWKGQEIAGDLNKLRYLASTEIRNIILDEIPEKAVKYLDYGNLKNIAERGKNAMTKPWMSGGSGKVLSSILTSGTTPIQTLGGSMIKWLGKNIKSGIK